MKLLGDYASAMSPALYADTPKAVFAALALAVVHNGGMVSWGTADEHVVTEWDVQHKQGLIPQAVPARWRHLIRS